MKIEHLTKGNIAMKCKPCQRWLVFSDLNCHIRFIHKLVDIKGYANLIIIIHPLSFTLLSFTGKWQHTHTFPEDIILASPHAISHICTASSIINQASCCFQSKYQSILSLSVSHCGKLITEISITHLDHSNLLFPFRTPIWQWID